MIVIKFDFKAVKFQQGLNRRCENTVATIVKELVKDLYFSYNCD
jgi:hypothetical protein